MNTRLLASAGCLLLLAAATLPSALGHDERAALGGTADGVSGRYSGAAGPAVVDESSYPDTLATGSLLCDVEVAGDATTPFPQDERNVDGYAGAFPDNQAPDTWDDGGLGGACHVRTFGFEPYNTPGCPAEKAFASNGVPGGPFLAASCDWKWTHSDPTWNLCFINAIIQGQPSELVGCLLDVFCLNPMGCDEGGDEYCGSDGSSDGINYGHGVDGVPYPTAGAHQGDVAYGRDSWWGSPADCLPEDAAAAVFVFDAVGLDADGLPHVHPALAGEIWQGP